MSGPSPKFSTTVKRTAIAQTTQSNTQAKTRTRTRAKARAAKNELTLGSSLYLDDWSTDSSDPLPQESAVPAVEADIAAEPEATDADYSISTILLRAISKGLDGYEMPEGHYCFILDGVNHALALISYIALRSKRTVCGLPLDQDFKETRELLARITDLTVEDYSLVRVEGYADTEQRIYLRSYKQCQYYFERSACDCVICWGPPENIQQWIYQFLGRAKRIFMILTPEQYTATHQAILTSYIKPHPWSERLNKSFEDPVLERSIPVVPERDEVPDILTPEQYTATHQAILESYVKPHPWSEQLNKSLEDPVPERSIPVALKWDETPVTPPSLPEGHYHIVLKEVLDTIPLIAYLALQSTRTLCYLNTKSSWGSYVALLKQITGIETVYCDEKSAPHVKVAFKAFKSFPRGIMLRPANDRWIAGFGKSLADCVIYCGIPGPKNTMEFREHCLLKTKRSYLVLTPSQAGILRKRKYPGSSPHPSSDYFNDDNEDSVLGELRLKTGSVLENLYGSPISVNQYKARLRRRRKISTRYIDEPSSSNKFGSSIQAPGSESGVSAPLMFGCPLLEGRYVIPLDRSLDAVPLISYLALQSMRALCFLPAGSPWETYQLLFDRITGVKTLYCRGNSTSRIVSEMRSCPLDTSVMILCPFDDAWNFGFSESIVDCVIYWGLPNRLDESEENRILESSRSYVIIPRPQFTDRSIRFPGDGFWPHPSTGRFNDQTESSVLHGLRLKTGQVLTTMTDPPILAGASEEFPLEQLRSSFQDATLSSSHLAIDGHLVNANSSDLMGVQTILDCPLPEGHYCIPVDEALDSVPLISYLALRSTRTLCVIPAGEYWETYPLLFAQITELATTDCNETQADKVMMAMRSLKLKLPTIIMYPTDRAWAPAIRKSLVDCVIYWGCPDELEELKDSPLLLAVQSYLVMPDSHCAGIGEQKLSGYGFPRHPSSPLFNDKTQNSVLHGLRSRTGAILAGMANPPIPAEEYQDYLWSLNGARQTPV